MLRRSLDFSRSSIFCHSQNIRNCWPWSVCFFCKICSGNIWCNLFEISGAQAYCLLNYWGLNLNSLKLAQLLIDSDVESNPGPPQSYCKSPCGRLKKIKVFKGTPKTFDLNENSNVNVASFPKVQNVFLNDAIVNAANEILGGRYWWSYLWSCRARIFAWISE